MVSNIGFDVFYSKIVLQIVKIALFRNSSKFPGRPHNDKVVRLFKISVSQSLIMLGHFLLDRNVDN